MAPKTRHLGKGQTLERVKRSVAVGVNGGENRQTEGFQGRETALHATTGTAVSENTCAQPAEYLTPRVNSNAHTLTTGLWAARMCRVGSFAVTNLLSGAGC